MLPIYLLLSSPHIHRHVILPTTVIAATNIAISSLLKYAQGFCSRECVCASVSMWHLRSTECGLLEKNSSLVDSRTYQHYPITITKHNNTTSPPYHHYITTMSLLHHHHITITSRPCPHYLTTISPLPHHHITIASPPCPHYLITMSPLPHHHITTISPTSPHLHTTMSQTHHQHMTTPCSPLGPLPLLRGPWHSSFPLASIPTLAFSPSLSLPLSLPFPFRFPHYVPTGHADRISITHADLD